MILALIEAKEETARAIGLADRMDNIKPRKAKRSEVNRIIRVATEHSDELFTLWEEARS